MQALEALQKPLAGLGRRLEAVLEEAPDWLDSQARARVDGAIRGLGWRRETVAAWIALLARIGGAADPGVRRLARGRAGRGTRVRDRPCIAAGSTRRGRSRGRARPGARRAGDVGDAARRGGLGRAEARTGALHLARAADLSRRTSPFDYAGSAEVLVVTDIKQGDIASLAGAYARLIEAAGGGTLGLFTAIQRLKAVHARIADRLARAGLPLLAQHVDPIDAGTLVDIFRDDPRASLLGTDALRDGVDVPGNRSAGGHGTRTLAPSHRAPRRAANGWRR